MFKNYLLTTLRSIKRHKGYSFINITGLAVGMACCILIFLWLQGELSYDRFHENADNIYRIIRTTDNSGNISAFATTPNPIGPTLKKDYPEVVEFTRCRVVTGGWRVSYGEKFSLDNSLTPGDPGFFKMFTFPFLKGDPNTALNDPASIVITEYMANKYFGDEDPMGKVLEVGGAQLPLKVTGVIKNVPHHSHLKFDAVFPMKNMEVIWGENLENWRRDVRFHTYIQLREDSSGEEVSQKIAGIVKKYLPESKSEVFLQPLTDIYLRSNFEWDHDGLGNIANIYIFALTAVGILLIACINFMNLSTARAGTRAKEIGVRKVVGAYRKDLIKQFFGESIILAFIALLFAVILAFLFLPIFEYICGGELVIKTGFPGTVQVISSLLGITLLTGIVSGIYPALYLSYFQPVSAIKGISSRGRRRGAYLRKLLVVAQFAFAIILVIGSTVVYLQINFMKNKDLGFDKENVICVPGRGGFGKDLAVTWSELIKNPNILGVAKGAAPIGASLWGTSDFTWDGKEAGQDVKLNPFLLNFGYLEVMGMTMVQGRSFSKEFSTDVSNYILNETAVKAMGLESPLGKKMSYTGQGYIVGDDPGEGSIIGVVKDFHSRPLHNQIEPLVFKIYNGPGGNFYLKIKSENVDETIRFIENLWKRLSPGYPFSYEFLDERIDNFYENERRVATVSKYSGFLTIFIACLGLLGLVSFVAEMRTKEIGIRKVFGSSVPGIVMLLQKEYVKWIIAGMIIAFPIAWYVMNNWLQDFVYRISIGWWVFALVGAAVVVLALITVSYQAIKAALANPVKSLRYE